MGRLRVISKRGDKRVQWSEQDTLAGHTEAIAAIREAERIFAEERDEAAETAAQAKDRLGDRESRRQLV